MMKSVRIMAVIGVLALLPLLTSLGSAQVPDPTQVSGTEGTVAAAISYQGVLTDADGHPLTGTYDLEFSFWSLSSGGSQIGPTTTRMSQYISRGLYSTSLTVDNQAVHGQELWLRIRVRESGNAWQTLSPRVQVLPTMYAMTVRPGARIQGAPPAWEGAVLEAEIQGYYPVASAVQGIATATGYAVKGQSPNGVGVLGYSEGGYAVQGVDAGTTQAKGYGGYFRSATGVGVYGHSQAAIEHPNIYAPGVLGESDNGAGVQGVGEGTSSHSYGGLFNGKIGVRAGSSGSAANQGYAGIFESEYFRGIYVSSSDSFYAGYFLSDSGVYSSGGYSGALADRTLVVNGGSESLQVGDVVSMVGVAQSPIDSGELLLSVQKAQGRADAAVIGVVVQAVEVTKLELTGSPPGQTFMDVQPVEGDAPPGGYLAIVSYGLVAAARIGAADAGVLQVGDLVCSGDAPGTVQLAGAPQAAGTILGKVAGPYDPETSTVPVFVTLK